MTQPTYAYSREAMDQGIRDLKSATSKIDTRLNELETTVETHLAEWQGLSRMEYLNAKTAWENSVKSMNRIIDEEAAPALNRILENFEHIEKTNTRLWA